MGGAGGVDAAVRCVVEMHLYLPGEALTMTLWNQII
jgi:hypothetical protein